ncbi:MAG: hypothetical protein GX605_13145, partial [Chloroflexi bacterium]|nr:hypothetical protein [Chloroflexota bacterium]
YTRLILGGFAILLVVGGGLIWQIYGPGAAFTGVSCLAASMAIFASVFGLLKLVERWIRDD